MALLVTVRNGAGVVTDITDRVRLPGPDDDVGLQLGNRAFNCESGQSTLIIDDDNGEYGNPEGLPGGLTQLSIAAHNVVTVTETATDPDTVLLRGRVIPKEIGRADHVFGRARQVTLRLDDYNADTKGLGFLTDYSRPAETDVARVTWVYTTFLSGSPRATTSLTNGIVAGNTVNLPARKYEAGTQPYEVLSECATAAEKDVFVMANGTLYYGLPTDTSQVAGLRISDREDEINATSAGGTASLIDAWIGDVGSGSAGSGLSPVTIPAGLDNGVLFIAVGMKPAPGSWPPPTPEWRPTVGAAQTATLIGSITDGIALYYVANPTAGEGSFGTYDNPRWVGGWLFENVNQTSPTAESDFATGTGSSASGYSVAATSGATFISAVSIFSADFADDTFALPEAAAGMTLDWANSNELGTPGFVDMALAGGHGDASPTWTFDQSHDWAAFVARVNAFGDTFPPIPVGPASTEDGQGLLSGGVLRHADGFVTETRPSVAAEYDYWVETINDVAAVSAADAAARLSAILNVWQYEHRTYSVAIMLHRSQVHLIKAGQLIDIKWRATSDADDQYRTRRIASLEWQYAGPEHWLAVMELDKPIRTTQLGGSGPAAYAAVKAKKADPDRVRWEPVVWNGEVVYWNGDIVVHKVIV